MQQKRPPALFPLRLLSFCMKHQPNRGYNHFLINDSAFRWRRSDVRRLRQVRGECLENARQITNKQAD